MMKKLFVSILVLGMASLAGAGFSLDASWYSVGLGQEVSIWVYGSPNESTLLYLIIEDGYESILKDPVVYSTAGDLGAAVPYIEAGWTNSGYEITVADSGGSLPGGLLAEFTFVTLDIGDIKVSLYNNTLGYDIPEDSIVIRESPEPATLALMAAGGLFLNSKKKRKH